MKKLALLIGINYHDVPRAELFCCLNDVKTMTKKLVDEFNFDLKDIQFLIEEIATKQNILDGIERLVQELGPGDRGVIFYAGHGTQTPELPPTVEADKLDEALVPFDAINRNSINGNNLIIQKNLIRDNEIGEKLSRLSSGAHLWIVIDGCHSESGTRDPIAPVRWINPMNSLAYTTIKAIVNSNPSSARSENKTRNIFTTENINYYVLSACKADKLASEFPDGSNGYLTKMLDTYLKKDMTYQELYELVLRGVMEISNNSQEPQIEGPLLTRKILE